MITQCRPAYYTAPRAASFAGRSIDVKPIDVVDKEYVDAIIPAYAAADNGKVLGVVEGKLAWGTKA